MTNYFDQPCIVKEPIYMTIKGASKKQPDHFVHIGNHVVLQTKSYKKATEMCDALIQERYLAESQPIKQKKKSKCKLYD